MKYLCKPFITLTLLALTIGALGNTPAVAAQNSRFRYDAPTTETVTLISRGAQDGCIVESSQRSEAGGEHFERLPGRKKEAAN